MTATNQVSHTAGPWRVEQGRDRTLYVDAGKHHIARLTGSTVVGDQRAVFEANARLLAAAPELLEIVQAIADWPGDAFRVGLPLIEQAKAAIAKATA